jgi:hypothetical protein
MSSITEKDIREYLKEQIKFHTDEAKRMQLMLKVFDSSSVRPGRRSNYDAIEAALETPGSERSLDNYRHEKLNGMGPRGGKQLEVPSEYKDNLTLSSKIAYALNEIHDGFKEDIAEAMAQHEREADPEKISKQISGVLSAMKTRGQLRAEKVGRKDRFFMAEYKQQR